MNTKNLRIAAVIVAMALTISSCAKEDAAIEPPATRAVTDAFGRRVELPGTVKTVAAIGGASRLLTYAGCADMLVGVTDLDKKPSSAMPYSVVNAERFAGLPSVGSGGSNDTTYDEAIVGLAPDVIFGLSEERVRELAEKTGIPTIGLSVTGPFDGSLAASLALIGEITGSGDRCAELVAALESWAVDLDARTRGVSDSEKPTVYAGAISFRGAHGFDGTMAHYPPFEAIGARNVADETGQKGAFLVDPEKVLEWDPDFIFLNPTNMYLVDEDYAKNRAFYDGLSAVKAGRVYSQLSYNYNYTNIEIAVADAYYAGTVIYPERFADVDIAAKADEVFVAMLGAPFYGRLAADGLVFGPIALGD